ncbi:unnamed protein product [Arabidopsis halleri]
MHGNIQLAQSRILCELFRFSVQTYTSYTNIIFVFRVDQTWVSSFFSNSLLSLDHNRVKQDLHDLIFQ